MNAPIPDNNAAMREALRRDAARVQEPPFDAALHHAGMRRIRALAEPAAATSRFHLLPTLATATAALALAALFALRGPHSPHPLPQHEAAADFTPQPTAPRASMLAYQTAASRGDEMLFALLDRDARELLPASSPVFNTTLR